MNPEQYGLDVISGKIPAGELVRLAAQKHFDEKDKQRTDDFPYYFDEVAGQKPITFFSIMRHYKGRFYGKKFIPEPWQAFVLYCFFGWKRMDGRRRYKYMYIEVPRKNGKSTFMAGLALFHILSDDENAPEIYFTATKEKQARIVLDEARKIARTTPELAKRLKILQYTIEYEKKNGKMESLGGDSKRQDGLNVSLWVLDEVHEHKTFDMFEVLKTACGMRDQPMICMITTAGYNKEYPCYYYRKKCIDVLQGTNKQNNLFALIYTLDEDDNWKDEASWIKANPSWRLMNKEEFKDEAEEAKTDPSMEVGFLTKRLNVWTNAPDVWIKDEVWMKCDLGPVEGMESVPAYGGLDIASTKDITALVLTFNVDGVHHVKPYFWIPEEKVIQKEDIVDYWLWKKQGFVRVLPGNVINIEELVDDIYKILDSHNIIKLAYDRWGSDAIIQGLVNRGFPLQKLDKYKQTTLDMTVPTKELEADVYSQKLNHAGNPVLRWMASNVVLYMDSSGGIKFAKDKSIDKIDGMVCLAMCYGAEISNRGEGPINFTPTFL